MAELVEILNDDSGIFCLELWRICDEEGYISFEMRLSVFNEDLGWLAQRRIPMSAGQALGMQRAIAMSGVSARDVPTRAERVRRLPHTRDKVVTLHDVRQELSAV